MEGGALCCHVDHTLGVQTRWRSVHQNIAGRCEVLGFCGSELAEIEAQPVSPLSSLIELCLLVVQCVGLFVQPSSFW